MNCDVAKVFTDQTDSAFYLFFFSEVVQAIPTLAYMQIQIVSFLADETEVQCRTKYLFHAKLKTGYCPN